MKALKIILGFLLIVGLALPVYAQGERHWNKNMLVVYIQPESEYTPFMVKAFKEWEARFARKIQFMATDRAENARLAEIDVKFNQVTGEEAVNSGSTSLIGQTDIIRHASVVINTKFDEEIEKDPEKKAENEAEIYSVMLQQVGKIMGLQNSSNPQSVMYDKLQPEQTILQEDVDKVYTIYGWKSRNSHSPNKNSR